MSAESWAMGEAARGQSAVSIHRLRYQLKCKPINCSSTALDSVALKGICVFYESSLATDAIQTVSLHLRTLLELDMIPIVPIEFSSVLQTQLPMSELLPWKSVRADLFPAHFLSAGPSHGGIQIQNAREKGEAQRIQKVIRTCRR